MDEEIIIRRRYIEEFIDIVTSKLTMTLYQNNIIYKFYENFLQFLSRFNKLMS